MTGKVSDVDPSLCFITWFANVVELYQKGNCNIIGCGSPDHLAKDCWKEVGNTSREGRFKLERGDGKEGRPILSEGGDYARGHPQAIFLRHKNMSESSLPESRPTHALEWA